MPIAGPEEDVMPLFHKQVFGVVLFGEKLFRMEA
jgi:hypothetical protein